MPAMMSDPAVSPTAHVQPSYNAIRNLASHLIPFHLHTSSMSIFDPIYDYVGQPGCSVWDFGVFLNSKVRPTVLALAKCTI